MQWWCCGDHTYIFLEQVGRSLRMWGIGKQKARREHAYCRPLIQKCRTYSLQKGIWPVGVLGRSGWRNVLSLRGGIPHQPDTRSSSQRRSHHTMSDPCHWSSVHLIPVELFPCIGLAPSYLNEDRPDILIYASVSSKKCCTNIINWSRLELQLHRTEKAKS